MFHPVAVGTIEEATNRLKLLMSKGRRGRLSEQTGRNDVNAGQASPLVPARVTPTSRIMREGRRRRIHKGRQTSRTIRCDGSAGVDFGERSVEPWRRHVCKEDNATRETRHGGDTESPTGRPRGKGRAAAGVGSAHSTDGKAKLSRDAGNDRRSERIKRPPASGKGPKLKGQRRKRQGSKRE